MKTPPAQLARVRAWEKKNPKRAQARKNRWWQTQKGKAAIARRREKFNAYRRKWRADRKRLKPLAGSPSPPSPVSAAMRPPG
jgi:hypothetical protein